MASPYLTSVITKQDCVHKNIKPPRTQFVTKTTMYQYYLKLIKFKNSQLQTCGLLRSFLSKLRKEGMRSYGLLMCISRPIANVHDSTPPKQLQKRIFGSHCN